MLIPSSWCDCRRVNREKAEVFLQLFQVEQNKFRGLYDIQRNMQIDADSFAMICNDWQQEIDIRIITEVDVELHSSMKKTSSCDHMRKNLYYNFWKSQMILLCYELDRKQLVVIVAHTHTHTKNISDYVNSYFTLVSWFSIRFESSSGK